MADLWMSGAERRPEGNGGSMAGGPARAVWHITWDSLGKGGKQPAFDNIAGYLQSVNYAPHLMWDPWTGRIVQFYPANQSARALAHPAGTAETNRMGRVCIQIEVFFSPGAVRDGRKYATVADTPCKGLPEIMAWLRSWGVEDEWPSGWPRWSGNSRNAANWRNRSGHFGHCHVPANDHTDPGPMPRWMFEEDDVVSEDDRKAIAKETVEQLLTAKYNRRGHTVGVALETAHDGVLQLLARDPAAADVDEGAIAAAVLAGLTPEKIAAAIPAELAEQVVNELAARIGNP